MMMMDRKVDMALFSANNWINYQLEMQKAAIQIIRNAIEETKKAYKLQSKQDLDKDEGVEFFHKRRHRRNLQVAQ